MSDPVATEQFVQKLAESQNRLYGYVYSLLGDHGRAADVLQETNLVLWRKLDEFAPNREFLPWAFTIARYQVLASIRDHKRDRVLLDAELAEKVAAVAERESSKLDGVQAALRVCVEELSIPNRELIRRRYTQSESIADLAGAMDKTQSAIKVSLLRIRRRLADCIQKRLAAEGPA